MNRSSRPARPPTRRPAQACASCLASRSTCGTLCSTRTCSGTRASWCVRVAERRGAAVGATTRLQRGFSSSRAVPTRRLRRWPRFPVVLQAGIYLHFDAVREVVVRGHVKEEAAAAAGAMF